MHRRQKLPISHCQRLIGPKRFEFQGLATITHLDRGHKVWEISRRLNISLSRRQTAPRIGADTGKGVSLP
jgi:hypothetical protein